MNEQYRVCPECGKKQKLDMYLPTSNSSLYGIKGMSYICIECIANKIDRKDLASIDKLCQFLDLPYDANK
jgi:DNA-directed RNA polymerase subunit RPC12/RpoP